MADSTNTYCLEVLLKKLNMTYKLKKEGVFPQSTDASCEAEHEHHPSNHKKQPHWVKPTQIRDGGYVGENPLMERRTETKLRITFMLYLGQDLT